MVGHRYSDSSSPPGGSGEYTAYHTVEGGSIREPKPSPNHHTVGHEYRDRGSRFHRPRPAADRAGGGVARAGRLVAFPTETVYGLGANALDPAAVRGIFGAKGRPATNPLIVHVADPSLVANVAADWPATASRLAEQFWPGPLTIVVPKRSGRSRRSDGRRADGGGALPEPPGRAEPLLRAAGVPLAAPSANRSTELSPTRAEHVLKGLGGRIDMVLDGGPCPGGIESTVVDVTGPVVRVLRPGLITVPMLEEVVGPGGSGRLLLKESHARRGRWRSTTARGRNSGS